MGWWCSTASKPRREEWDCTASGICFLKLKKRNRGRKLSRKSRFEEGVVGISYASLRNERGWRVIATVVKK